MTETTRASAVTIPLSGLPDSCPHCGEQPPHWPLSICGHLLNVTCPACFTAVAPVRAVAATDPDCE